MWRKIHHFKECAIHRFWHIHNVLQPSSLFSPEPSHCFPHGRPFYSPTGNEWEFQFPHIPPTLGIFLVLSFYFSFFSSDYSPPRWVWKWHLVSLLICISLVTDYVEHLFMSIGAASFLLLFPSIFVWGVPLVWPSLWYAPCPEVAHSPLGRYTPEQIVATW